MVFGFGSFSLLRLKPISLLSLSPTVQHRHWLTSFKIGESDDAHRQVYREGGGYDNQAKFSHELIAGGAAFEGFKLFEDHQRKEGT